MGDSSHRAKRGVQCSAVRRVRGSGVCNEHELILYYMRYDIELLGFLKGCERPVLSCIYQKNNKKNSLNSLDGNITSISKHHIPFHFIHLVSLLWESIASVE